MIFVKHKKSRECEGKKKKKSSSPFALKSVKGSLVALDHDHSF